MNSLQRRTSLSHSHWPRDARYLSRKVCLEPNSSPYSHSQLLHTTDIHSKLDQNDFLQSKVRFSANLGQFL